MYTSDEKKRKFIKPSDKFYPTKYYKTCLKENMWTPKERKTHTAHTEDGVAGWLVPNANADSTPWDVEDSTSTIITKRRRVSEETDEAPTLNIADRVFQDLAGAGFSGGAEGSGAASSSMVESSAGSAQVTPIKSGRRQKSKEGSDGSDAPAEPSAKAKGRKAKSSKSGASSGAAPTPSPDGGTAKSSGGAGRPPKDIPAYTNTLQTLFEKAGQTSVFFNPDLAVTTMQAMQRVINKINEKLVTLPDDSDEQREMAGCRKRLQIMMESAKLVRLKNVSGWQAKFLIAWEQLLTFCCAEPFPAKDIVTFPAFFGRFRIQAVSQVNACLCVGVLPIACVACLWVYEFMAPGMAAAREMAYGP